LKLITEQKYFTWKPNGGLHEFRNYFLVLLFILVEDSPFFFDRTINIIMRAIIFIILLYYVKKNFVINDKIVILILGVAVLMIIQGALYGSLNYTFVYKPIWMFLAPYLLFRILKLDYFKYFFNIVYFTTITSLIIYSLYTFIPPFNEFLRNLFVLIYPYSGADWARTILIFHIPQPSGFFFERNGSIFHEAGAYGIYSMMAVFINTIYSKNPFQKKNLILFIGIVTTFSTTAYIIMFLFLSYFLLTGRTNILVKIVIIISFFIVSKGIYNESVFLEQKIRSHYYTQMASIEGSEKNVRGRFFALGMSVKSFLESPVFGRGIDDETRIDIGEIGAFGYGIPGLFARFGFLFALLYLFYLFKGYYYFCKINQMNKSFIYLFIIVINIGLLTQVLFFFSTFIYFFYIGLFKKELSEK